MLLPVVTDIPPMEKGSQSYGDYLGNAKKLKRILLRREFNYSQVSLSINRLFYAPASIPIAKEAWQPFLINELICISKGRIKEDETKIHLNTL